jgi:class 3 adenylate cyclase
VITLVKLLALLRGVCPRQRHALCPQHRTILAFDVCGFGRWDNQNQLHVREALSRMVRNAFRTAGCARSQLTVEDRGDGMIAPVAGKVCKLSLIDPMVPCLARSLHEHNAAVAEPRIRLRVAMHAGEVHRDAVGWASSDLTLVCRLVDCDSVRTALRESPDSDLAFVVSEAIHHSLVRHEYRGIDPSAYRRIRASVKEVDVPAWVRITPACPDAASRR